jgi:O-antigen/teichoic acid export membrane protein
VTAVAAIFNVPLNIVLIPRFSHDGAALATLATELLLVSITLAITRRHDGFRPLRLSTLACLGVTLAMGAAAWLAQPLPMPLGLGVAAMVHLSAGWLVWRCWLRQRWISSGLSPAPFSSL